MSASKFEVDVKHESLDYVHIDSHVYTHGKNIHTASKSGLHCAHACTCTHARGYNIKECSQTHTVFAHIYVCISTGTFQDQHTNAST